ncbi:MAG: ribonuclease HII [Bacteriovorax sp.]|nr:ribonuclease HII [Bacteriovorax sp.]
MFDLKYFRTAFKETSLETSFFIAGTDEVGRGPLAGPVVAASVSLHFEKYEEKELRTLLKEWQIFGINDSKKLTSEKRQEILSDFPFSKDQMTVNQIYTHSYSKNMSLKVLIKEISPQLIDEINILNASLRAMKEAVTESCDFEKTGLVLIDGNKKFKSETTTVELVSVIQGDSKSLLIGAASIIAKEYRDQLMTRYCEQYPGYHWRTNAGYGTAKHLEAISLLGITEIHRKTFSGVKEFYEERG